MTIGRRGAKAVTSLPKQRKRFPQEIILDEDRERARIKIVRYSGMMYWALIDSEDIPLISQYKWWIDIGNGKRTPYAAAATFETNGRRKNVLMHRILMGEPPGVVDHQDGDGMNNRRSNLRLATTSQNRANELVARAGTTSQYKGVTRSSADIGGWIAQGLLNGKFRNLGTYDREIDAALAYDDAARTEFGEFAATNFTAEFSAQFVRWPRRSRRDSLMHGKSGYTRGCRCEVCVRDQQIYMRAYRSRALRKEAV